MTTITKENIDLIPRAKSSGDVVAKFPEENRLAHIDLLRACGVLYVVGFWHLLNYTSVFPDYSGPISVRITLVILGVFVLISGLLLGASEVDFSIRSGARFIAKRILRIYPLFIIALIWYWACGLIDGPVFWKSAAVGSMIFGPAPMTLWFVVMLIMFYVGAIILIPSLRFRYGYLVSSVLLFGVALIMHFSLPHGDLRVALYFPAFALGVYLSKRIKFIERRRIISVMALTALAVVFSLVDNDPGNCLTSIPLVATGALLAVVCCSRIKSPIPRSKIIRFISSASYVMYLLHPPLFTQLKELYFPVCPEGQLAYLLFFCLPFITIFSWLIQCAYDHVLRRCGR